MEANECRVHESRGALTICFLEVLWEVVMGSVPGQGVIGLGTDRQPAAGVAGEPICIIFSSRAFSCTCLKDSRTARFRFFRGSGCTSDQS